MQGRHHPFALAIKRQLDLRWAPTGGGDGQLGTGHADHGIVFVQLPGGRVPHRARYGPAALGLEHDHGQLAAVGHGLRLRQAHAVELQRVVAHKQRGDQVLLLLRLGTTVGLHHYAPAAARRGAEHAPHRSRHGHPALSTKAARGHFAVGQHLGVQAHTGVDDKHAPVDKTDLHRAQVAVAQRLQHVLHGGFGVQRQAVFATEVVERAHGHHPQWHPRQQRRRGHGVDGAVTPCRHHQPAIGQRSLRGIARQLHDVAALVGHMPDHVVLLQGGHALQLGAQQVQVGPGALGHHQVDGPVGTDRMGMLGRGHGSTAASGGNAWSVGHGLCPGAPCSHPELCNAVT